MAHYHRPSAEHPGERAATPVGRLEALDDPDAPRSDISRILEIFPVSGCDPSPHTSDSKGWLWPLNTSRVYRVTSRPGWWPRTCASGAPGRASHEDLLHALVAWSFDKGNVSTSLKGLEAKGLVTITRTPGGKAEAVDLTADGRTRVAALTASCE